MFMGAASALAPLRLTHTNKSPAHHGTPFAPREGLRTLQQQPTNTRTATEFTDPRTSVRLKRMKFFANAATIRFGHYLRRDSWRASNAEYLVDRSTRTYLPVSCPRTPSGIDRVAPKPAAATVHGAAVRIDPSLLAIPRARVAAARIAARALAPYLHPSQVAIPGNTERGSLVELGRGRPSPSPLPARARRQPTIPAVADTCRVFAPSPP